MVSGHQEIMPDEYHNQLKCKVYLRDQYTTSDCNTIVGLSFYNSFQLLSANE